MKTFALLLIAANICLADDSPEMSFSSSIPVQNGWNLTAWKDTVAVVGGGSVAYYKGVGDRISTISTYAGSVASQSARLFHRDGSPDLVATENGIGALVGNGNSFTFRSVYYAATALSPRTTYPKWIDGGDYEKHAGTGVIRGMLNCLGGSRYLETSSTGRWELVSTSDVYGATRNPIVGGVLSTDHCDIETSTGVAAYIRWVAGTKWTVSTDDPVLQTRSGRTWSFDAGNVDWVVSGWKGHWLAMDQTNSGMMYHDRVVATGTVVDSFRIPGLAMRASSGAQVARNDSLVVFGSDSTIVAFKWKPDGVSASVMGLLPGGTIRAVALADTSLWLLTSTDLVRIRIGWPTGSVSGTIRESSLSRNLSIAGIDGGAKLTWTGSGNAEIRLTDAAGRFAESIALRSGETRNWHAPSRGVYFASSPTGSRRLLVR